MKRILLSIMIGLVIMGVITIGNGLAQQQPTPPNIKVSLALTNSRLPNQLVYLLDDPTTPQVDPDPIRMAITLKNHSGADIYTAEGFIERPFHLFLVFTDPDKKPISASDLASTIREDPPPPRVIWVPALADLVQVDPVESLSGVPAWLLTIEIPNAHAFYSLSKAGIYSVKALIPMRTYHSIDYPGPPDYSAIDSFKWSGALQSNAVDFTLVADKDKDGYSYPIAVSPPHHSLPDCDDNNPNVNPGMPEILFNGIDDDCNPQTSDGAEGRGVVIIKAEHHKVGSGSYPGSTKSAIEGMEVRLFDKFSSCVAPYSASWQNYEAIWACTSAAVYCYPSGDAVDHCKTDGNGTANMIVPAGNYIAIGQYTSTAYVGVSVGGVDAGQTVNKYLQVIEKADGKNVPAKYTVKTGSELLIIEPEYIEWDGTQELYPFLFESIGDWTVTTSVSPPEGFLPDYKSLSTEVNTTLKALQFTIMEVGSRWDDTKVEHKIKHKGKIEIIKSKIGVKKLKK